MSEENKVDSKAAFISWYVDLHAVSPNARSLLEQITGRGMLPQHLLQRLTKEGISEDNFWIWRECARNMGEHIVPTDFDMLRQCIVDMPEHFLHLSAKDEGYVAYTPDVKHGLQDRQIRTTIGRYLTKHFGHRYSESEIRSVANSFRERYKQSDVLWATTEEDLTTVYTSGPSSCMVKPFRDSAYLNTHVHPAVVYAGSTLAVAYLKRDGRINARNLVNMETKQYVRNYGDDVLRIKLELLGYTAGSLAGARLRKIFAIDARGKEFNSRLILPYLDDREGKGFHYVQVYDDHLKVVSSAAGKHDPNLRIWGAQGTSGMLSIADDKMNFRNWDAAARELHKNGIVPYVPKVYHCGHCNKEHSEMQFEAGRIADYVVTGNQRRMLCRPCLDSFYVNAMSLTGYVMSEKKDCTYVSLSDAWYTNDALDLYTVIINHPTDPFTGQRCNKDYVITTYDRLNIHQQHAAGLASGGYDSDSCSMRLPVWNQQGTFLGRSWYSLRQDKDVALMRVELDPEGVPLQIIAAHISVKKPIPNTLGLMEWLQKMVMETAFSKRNAVLLKVAKHVETQPYGPKVYGFLTEKMNAFVEANPQYRKKTAVRKTVVECTEEEPA